MKRGGESRKRSLVKAITYRILVSIVAWVIAYYYTESTQKAVEVIIWYYLGSGVIYYLHERIWARISLWVEESLESLARAAWLVAEKNLSSGVKELEIDGIEWTGIAKILDELSGRRDWGIIRDLQNISSEIKKSRNL
jgi:uncharacterized membrane protein